MADDTNSAPDGSAELKNLPSSPTSSGASSATPAFMWQSIGMWQGPYQGYTETLEEVEQVLQEYEISTGSKFIVSYKRINFGKNFKDMLDVKHKVIWQVNDIEGKPNSLRAGLVIPFDNVPFIFAGKKVYECRHGTDKGVCAKLRWKKLAEERTKKDPKFKVRTPRVQPSFKVGCRAQIHITHVIRFPQYEIVNDGAYWKRTIANKLKHTMKSSPDTIQTTQRFYISLADIQDHKNHALKDIEMMRKAHNLRGNSPRRTQGRRRKSDAAVSPTERSDTDVSCSEGNDDQPQMDFHQELVDIQQSQVKEHGYHHQMGGGDIPLIQEAVEEIQGEMGIHPTTRKTEQTHQPKEMDNSSDRVQQQIQQYLERETDIPKMEQTPGGVSQRKQTTRVAQKTATEMSLNREKGPTSHHAQRENEMISSSQNKDQFPHNVMTQDATVIEETGHVSANTSTVMATRCAKVLERLINATFMVENADKLADLERKANDLLHEAHKSIKVEDQTCAGQSNVSVVGGVIGNNQSDNALGDGVMRTDQSDVAMTVSLMRTDQSGIALAGSVIRTNHYQSDVALAGGVMRTNQSAVAMTSDVTNTDQSNVPMADDITRTNQSNDAIVDGMLVIDQSNLVMSNMSTQLTVPGSSILEEKDNSMIGLELSNTELLHGSNTSTSFGSLPLVDHGNTTILTVEGTRRGLKRKAQDGTLNVQFIHS